MSDGVAADAEDEAGEAAVPPLFEPVRVVPTRPDSWPDWLGRRPISSVDRDRILKDLSADQEELDAVKRRDGLRLAPLFSSVTIEGFGGQGDPRKVVRLRAAGLRRGRFSAHVMATTLSPNSPVQRQKRAPGATAAARLGSPGSRGVVR